MILQNIAVLLSCFSRCCVMVSGRCKGTKRCDITVTMALSDTGELCRSCDKYFFHTRKLTVQYKQLALCQAVSSHTC